MKIGLVGSGGREHAMAKALVRDLGKDVLYVLGSHVNPGMAALATNYQVGNISDPGVLLDYFRAQRVDLVVIGPEAPLMSGAVDVLRRQGIPVIGPTKLQAFLEGSKSFMRDLLKKRVGWGSPEWAVVESQAQAREFITRVQQVAVKPIGLTGGKGVKVMGIHLHTVEEALLDAESIIQKDGRVLLEERVIGEEFSRIAFVSAGRISGMPVAQDYKYAYDGDLGNMTGGMGSYTCADSSMPFLSEADLVEADRMLADVVAALEIETGDAYRGFLYGQFMTTPRGLRVIEFNVRLGDPEAINLMALVDFNLPELLADLAAGKLESGAAAFRRQASVCKYLVPESYPESGQPVQFQLDEQAIRAAGFDLICASVKKDGSLWETLGSRTLALVGLGDDPAGISARMESLLEHFQPAGLRHRKDVGDGAVIQARVERMDRLRAGEDI